MERTWPSPLVPSPRVTGRVCPRVCAVVRALTFGFPRSPGRSPGCFSRPCQDPGPLGRAPSPLEHIPVAPSLRFPGEEVAFLECVAGAEPRPGPQLPNDSLLGLWESPLASQRPSGSAGGIVLPGFVPVLAMCPHHRGPAWGQQGGWAEGRSWFMLSMLSALQRQARPEGASLPLSRPTPSLPPPRLHFS